MAESPYDGSSVPASWVVSAYEPRVTDCFITVDDSKFSTCRDSVPVKVIFNLKCYNLAASGFKYADDDYGTATLSYNGFRYYVDLVNTLGGFVSKLRPETHIDFSGGAKPPAPVAGDNKVTYTTVDTLVQFTAMVHKDAFASGANNLRARVYVNEPRSSDFIETVTGYGRCYDSKVAGNSHYQDSDNNKVVNKYEPGEWDTYKVYGVSPSVTARDFIASKSCAVSYVTASLEHPEFSCNTASVKAPVELKLSWNNLLGKLFKYSESDFGTASLVFKKFRLRYEVRYHGTIVGGLEKVVSVSDLSLPEVTSFDGRVHYKELSGLFRDTLDINVSSLPSVSSADLNIFATVTPVEWVEDNVCFQNLYSSYVFGSLYSNSKFHFKKWCDDKWYELPCVDGSGTAYQKIGLQVIRENVYCRCSDLPDDGVIDESVDSLHFDVGFRFSWNNLAAKSAYYDGSVGSNATARYALNRFRYTVEILFTKDGHYYAFKQLGSDGEYKVVEDKYPSYSEGGTVNFLSSESDLVTVSGSVYIGDLITDYGLGVSCKITVYPNGYDEIVEGDWSKNRLGLVSSSPWHSFDSGKSFTRRIKPLDLSTSSTLGAENKYWIYNHPDAEFRLRLGFDGMKQGSYVGFFAGYGPLSTPFPGFGDCGVDDDRAQSLLGTLLPGEECSYQKASVACNRTRFEYFGDVAGYGCTYHCVDYGSKALYTYIKDNYVRKGRFSPGIEYLRRFARPRNLMLRTKSLSDYYEGEFYEDNIFKVDTVGVKGDFAKDRLFHLRDLEFVIPAPDSKPYSSNISPGDEFSVGARRFIKSDNMYYPFDDCEETIFLAGFSPDSKWDETYPEEKGLFDSGYKVAHYMSQGPDGPWSYRDIFSKTNLRFLVVPALRFEALTEAEKDSLYHCANPVYDVKELLEDDVIHLYAKELSLDDDKGAASVSRSDYGIRRYWEYSTEPESGKWMRVDTDEQFKRFFVDSRDLPWVPEKMKNDSDLWINSAVLLEQGVRTGKVLHFRQAAVATRFTSSSQSDLYSEKVGDGLWAVKVVSDDYYTVVAIPNITHDNLKMLKGGDDLYICWGDTIPSGQDSLVYTLQKGGDIRTERELSRLLDGYAGFRAERVTRAGVLDITSGIKVSGGAAHLQMLYYKPAEEKAPVDGDTIVYRFYVNSCRNTVVDSVRLITFPRDVFSIDSVFVEDGYIASIDPYQDTILVRAERGVNPKVLVRGAQSDIYKYVWHKRTNINDYDGMLPLPYASYIPYWTDDQLVEFSKLIGLECDSNAVDKYYNDYYNFYSTDPGHPEFGGFVVKTKFDSPYVTTAQRRSYCYFILDEVNACRRDKAEQQYLVDNTWQGFTYQGDVPWVRLTPQEKYLTMDENFFFIRREGRYGSPCGQGCPSGTIRLTVRYYEPVTDNVIDFDGADSVSVFFNDPVPVLHGTATKGGYGDPYDCPDVVSRRYFWQTATDPEKGVWETVQNVDGQGTPFFTQPFGEPADKYTDLPEGVLTARGGQFFIRRGVWSILESDTLSAIESFSNIVKVVSARLLDEGDLVHNTRAGQTDISLCPAASDYIVMCEPEANIDHNTRYVWDIRFDADGVEVPHTEFSDNYDYVRRRENPPYPDINNAVTVDNISGSYTVRVFRLDAATGMYSDTVTSRVHMWRVEPSFLYATSEDGFGTWHTPDASSLREVAAGSLTRLRASGFVEEEDESLRLWTLQVQEFVEGERVMGYQSSVLSPYLYLYNGGKNVISLHTENLHGCSADVEGTIVVDAPYYSSGSLKSAFVPDDSELYGVSPSELRGSRVTLFPTVTVPGGEVFVRTALEGYDLLLFDCTGRVVLSASGLDGDCSFSVTGAEGVYTAVIGSEVFRIIVSH